MIKGNKITVFALIIIIFMGSYARLNMPMSNNGKPTNRITYSEIEYIYAETVKAAPIKFIKAKKGSDEGFRLLIMRKDKGRDIPEEVYIYTGNRQYLKYIRNY